MRKLLLLLFFALPAWAQQSSPPALPTNLYTLPGCIPSAPCVSASISGPTVIYPASQFGITFDGQFCGGTHVSWANTSTTVTTDSTCPFTAADGGKKGFGVNCATGGTACVAASAIRPIGTITFVNSTTINVSGNSTAACNTANCQFWWFTDDRAKWCCGAGTVDNAISTARGCVSVISPAGISPIPFGAFNTSSATCGIDSTTGTLLVNTDAGNTFFGQGIGATIFLYPPDNNFASCTAANSGCNFFGIHGGGNFTITGGGNGLTGTHSGVLFEPNPQASFWENISLTEFGSGDLGVLFGIRIPFSNKLSGIYVDQFGQDACDVETAPTAILTNGFCGDVSGNALTIGNSGAANFRSRNLQIGGSTSNSIVKVLNGSVWYSVQDQVYTISNGADPNTVFVDGTSAAYFDNWIGKLGSGQSSYGLLLAAGAKVFARNSIFAGNTHCIGTRAVAMTTGAFFDQGGNTCNLSSGGLGTVETTLIPTCAMTTGGGTGPACSLVLGSTNEKGTVHMTPGTTPGSSGTTTITFAGTFAGTTNSTPSCSYTLANTGTGTWNARGTVIFATRSTTVPVFAWDNNAVALTAASTYDVDYSCVPR